MDAQTLINLLLSVVLAGVGWVARELWGAVKKLRDDLQKIEVALPTNYVRKDEFQSSMQEIKQMLQKISDKIDGKADKE